MINNFNFVKCMVLYDNANNNCNYEKSIKVE